MCSDFLFRGRTVCLALLMLAIPSAAAERAWTGNESDDWFGQNNWSPAGLPDPADLLALNVGTAQAAVAVTIAGGGAVSIDGAAVAWSLAV